MVDQLIIVQNFNQKNNILNYSRFDIDNYIDLQNFQTIHQKLMANHKSAKKRSRQTIKKNEINSQVLSRIKTSIAKFELSLKDKNKAELDKSLCLINSSLARGSKKGLIKKKYVSRKLSSLSKKIKYI